MGRLDSSWEWYLSLRVNSRFQHEGPLFGGPRAESPAILGAILGPLIFGKPQMALTIAQVPFEFLREPVGLGQPPGPHFQYS